MRIRLTVTVLLLGAVAAAQQPDTGILLNLDVGYNTAYRNASWVPVDVYVDNKQRDLTGWVEVQVFNAGNVLQSPTYRVAADCPQNSKKRFRLYVWIDNATRVEALLYENDRLAVDAPAYVEPQPIEPQDFLAVVLDDDPLNYQFLYEPLRRYEKTRRLSREDLGSSTLGQLPDRLACYEALDFVVMGDVDYSRIQPTQRNALLEYVELGGTLVVFTGVHAQRVRDSWLAPHLGVEIESLKTQPEALYRAAVFGDVPPAQVDQNRVSTSAVLREADPNVLVYGKNDVLATRNKRGEGQIITLAIDAAGNVLQDDPRYTDLWSQILASVRSDFRSLNLNTADMTFVNNLPQVSGVTIRPVSDVLIYLALYIGVGIVLNWIFWSRMGRREYAWLTLLAVSFSFTAYAVISGTSGIEGRQSRHSVTLIHLGKNATLSWQYTLNGILSARVTEISLPVETPDVLVREAGVAHAAGNWGMPQSSFQRPFHFIEEPDPAIRKLRIGANEVRGYSATRYARVDGLVYGVVEQNETGISATITNDTEMPIAWAVLYWRGRFYPLERQTPEGPFVRVENPNIYDPRMQVFDNAAYGGYWSSGFYSGDWETLISYLMLSPFMDEETSAPNPYLGPYFIGRLEEPSRNSAEPQESNNSTILLAEIDYRAGQAERFPLPQRIGTYSRYSIAGDRVQQSWQATLSSTPLELYLSVPPQMSGMSNSAIEVELALSGNEARDVTVAGARNATNGIVELSTDPGDSERDVRFVKRYRINDWQQYFDTVTRDIRLLIGRQDSNNTDPINIYVKAEIVIDNAGSVTEEWPGWQ